MDFSSSVFIVLESFLRFYTYFISYFLVKKNKKTTKIFGIFGGGHFSTLCVLALFHLFWMGVRLVIVEIYIETVYSYIYV